MNKFKIGETGKYGNGMFAIENIKSSETIYDFAGQIFTYDEIMDQVNSGEENIDDPLQIDDMLFLNLDETSRTFNHSCDPNSAIRGRSQLFAIKDILPGEEITYDYSSVVGPNITPDMWTMRCKCGSEKCRGTIGNVQTIPKDMLNKYIEAGALQHYIKIKLN